MKKKYADYRDWNTLKSKRIINKYFDSKEFKGNIYLLTDIKVNEKMAILEGDKEIIIMDDNYKWLTIYPEINKNISASVVINDKNEIVEWYFDVAQYRGLTKNGIPYIYDLYLDVIIYPSGEIKLIDEEELKKALLNNEIDENDFKLAYDVVHNLLNNIQGKIHELTEFTYKYFNYLCK